MSPMKLSSVVRCACGGSEGKSSEGEFAEEAQQQKHVRAHKAVTTVRGTSAASTHTRMSARLRHPALDRRWEHFPPTGPRVF